MARAAVQADHRQVDGEVCCRFPAPPTPFSRSLSRRPQSLTTTQPAHVLAQGSRPQAGLPDSLSRPSTTRQASLPSRQITPPSPAQPSCGVKRPLPSGDGGDSVRQHSLSRRRHAPPSTPAPMLAQAKRRLSMASETELPSDDSSPTGAPSAVATGPAFGYMAGAITVQPPSTKRRTGLVGA